MIASGQQITDETRQEWLAERRHSIGASEAAAVLGLDPHRSPLGVYLAKTGALPPEEPGEAAEWGLRLEPLIAEVWQERTGRRIVERQVFARSPVDPFSATLDALDEHGVPVEFKTISALRARGALGEGGDELPPGWIVQAHMQMFLVGADRVDFAVLVGGQQLRTDFAVERNDDLLTTMLPDLRAFWGRVQERIPPPPSVPSDARLMAALHPGVVGEMELRGDDAYAAQRYVELGQKIRVMEGERELRKAGLLAAMGPCARAIVPGLGVLSRRVVKVDAATVDRKAYSFIDLRLKKGGDLDGQG